MSLEEKVTIRKSNTGNFPRRDRLTNTSFIGNQDNKGTPVNISDSAYESMVCSPFSPVINSKDNKASSTECSDNFISTHDSVSPFLENTENEDVFRMSLEHIYTEGDVNVPMSNALFRPISNAAETGSISSMSRFPFNSDDRHSPIIVCHSNSKKSHRSISTQTRVTISNVVAYRPNSAPLQEYLEEELDEINSGNYNCQIPRNSTYHCIRSPMPDLIQPTLENHRENQLVASRLSLIADEIEGSISPVNTTQTYVRRRRLSTPALSEMTPGGSILDLLFSIYNAFDSGYSRRRSTTFSHSEHNESDDV